MVGLAVVAKPLIELLLTEKWLMAVPFLQIACFSYALEPLQTANLNAIKSVGRSDIFLGLEIVKKTIAIGILVASTRFGVLAIAISSAMYSLIATMINSFPNRKLLNYGYFEQVKDILPSVLLSGMMAVIIFPLSMVIHNNILLLLTQIVVGAAVYILLSLLMRNEAFNYCWAIMKPVFARIKKWR